jgi:hypothetical protein
VDLQDATDLFVLAFLFLLVGKFLHVGHSLLHRNLVAVVFVSVFVGFISDVVFGRALVASDATLADVVFVSVVIFVALLPLLGANLPGGHLLLVVVVPSTLSSFASVGPSDGLAVLLAGPAVARVASIPPVGPFGNLAVLLAIIVVAVAPSILGPSVVPVEVALRVPVSGVAPVTFVVFAQLVLPVGLDRGNGREANQQKSETEEEPGRRRQVRIWAGISKYSPHFGRSKHSKWLDWRSSSVLNRKKCLL